MTASVLVFANDAASTLAGAITNTSLSLNLASGGGALFPSPTGSQYFVLTALDSATQLIKEIMWCTARSGDTLTVVRAQEGTVAENWNPGDLIQSLWTAGQSAQMLQQGQAPSSIVYFGATDTGSVNAIVSTVTPTLASYADGQQFELSPAFANTITNPVANISGQGNIVIKRSDGSPLQPGDYQGSSRITVFYDAALPALLLANPALWVNNQGPGGQAHFQFASSTQVSLVPQNGSRIIIAGVGQAVPSSGVSAATTSVLVNGSVGSLSASTLYYVSAYMNAGTMNLAFWAASAHGHAPDTTAGNVGTEVITTGGTPNSAHSLVGMVFINSSSQFSDANAARYTLSWFNKDPKTSKTTFTTARSTTSNTLAEINAEIRSSFISWSTEQVLFGTNGGATLTPGTSGASSCQTGVSFDGGSIEADFAAIIFPIGSTGQPNTWPQVINSEKSSLSETVNHYATIFGNIPQVASGVTLTYEPSGVPGTPGIELIVTVRG